MRRISLLSGILWCLIFFLSCTSQKSDSPQVQFINPEVNTFHDLNNQLVVEADISDDVLVKEYKFWLESESGFEYFYEKKKINKPSHKILYNFDLHNNIMSNFSIHLEVKDDEGNKTHKEIKISVS